MENIQMDIKGRRCESVDWSQCQGLGILVIKLRFTWKVGKLLSSWATFGFLGVRVGAEHIIGLHPLANPDTYKTTVSILQARNVSV